MKISTNVKMKLPVICRTCDSRDPGNLYKLTMPTKKFPEKVLADILTELTEIDLNGLSAQKLPQTMCASCTRKLIGAYYFIRQAQVANALLLEHFQKNPDKVVVLATNDCLQEAPMEISDEPHVEIKVEAEDEELDNDIICTELPMFSKAQAANAAEVEAGAKKPLDPLITLDVVKLESNAATITKSPNNEEDGDSLDDVPLQQRAIHWKQIDDVPRNITKKRFSCDQCAKSFNKSENLKRHHVRTHKPKTEWLSCTLCTRKFSRTDSLQAHLKVHRDSKRSANLNDRKKAKDIDINLCKPHGYKLIECMLCQSKYTKISELRRHLKEHPTIDNFIEQQRPANEMAELFYPDMKQLTEDKLKTLISKDLAAGNYQRFYSITNQSGYEMHLDSSETESESELDGDEHTFKFKRTHSRSQYSCELCQEKFPRKYQLYEHQRHKHVWSEAPHVCGRCDARFVSLQLLRHHNQSQCKNAQKRFLCHKCPLRFRWKHNLRAHFREHKIANQKFECHECNRVFDKKKSLTVHLLSVHADESKLIPCQWCSRKFYRRDYLLKHLKRHGLKEQDIPLAETLITATSKPNGIKSINCKICNLQFERIADLRAHIQLELKLALTLHQTYESLSNYSITNESGFELHLDDSETEDELATQYKLPSIYICELCHVQCRRKFEVIQHQRTMHRFDKMPYECENCIFKCVCKSIMDHHKQMQCQSEQKKLFCAKCNYKFMWPENLERHDLLQHGGLEGKSILSNSSIVNADAGRQATEVSTASVPLLQCPHCDRTYQMKSRLNNHIRDVHINGDRKRKEAIKKFLCSLCGKETQSAASLVTHMRRHTGEKPFKCDMCEMAFPRHSEVLSHRRMHTGEKPFHCTVCGKDFARSDKLKRHMLIHSGLKPHKCTYCEKSYRQAKDLKLHLQQHTGECPFVCPTCGERFIQSSTLEKHRMMRRHFAEEDDINTAKLHT